MADHNYIASPALTVVRIGAPTRTMLDVDYSTSDEFEVFAEFWAREPVVGGDPIHIIGHTCEFQWSNDFTLATVHLDCAPQSLTIPATSEGEPVRAVALHLWVQNFWEQGANSPGGAESILRDHSVDDCGDIISETDLPRGTSTFECFVDDTQVMDLTSGPPPDTSVLFSASGQGTLPLPGYTNASKMMPSKAPFHPHDGQATPFSWLFWGPDEPGESFPDEISFQFSMTNVLFDNSRTIGLHDPGPYPGPNPPTVYTSTTAYVDVYPYIVLPEQEPNLMMVV